MVQLDTVACQYSRAPKRTSLVYKICLYSNRLTWLKCYALLRFPDNVSRLAHNKQGILQGEILSILDSCFRKRKDGKICFEELFQGNLASQTDRLTSLELKQIRVKTARDADSEQKPIQDLFTAGWGPVVDTDNDEDEEKETQAQFTTAV